MPKMKDLRESGIYTAEMGQPPDEPDMGSIRPRPRLPRPPARMQNLPGRMPPGTTMEDLINNKIKSGADRMQNLPGRVAPGTTLDDVINQKMRPGRGDAEITPMKKGGSVASASRRADGIAQRGKTKGRLV